MTKHSIIPLMLLVAFCTTACESHGQKLQKKDKRQIEKAAYGYLDATGNYRFKDAYKYATKETRERTLKFIEKNIMTKADTASLMRETPAVITITGITLTSDTTASVMFHKSTPVSERNNIIELVKRDKEWKVNMVLDNNQPDVLKKDKNTVIDTNSIRNKVFEVKTGAPPPPKKR